MEVFSQLWIFMILSILLFLGTSCFQRMAYARVKVQNSQRKINR